MAIMLISACPEVRIKAVEQFSNKTDLVNATTSFL